MQPDRREHNQSLEQQQNGEKSWSSCPDLLFTADIAALWNTTKLDGAGGGGGAANSDC